MEFLFIIAGVVLNRMFDVGLSKIKVWSEKSLLTDLALKKYDKPITYNDISYWIILLSVGSGNRLARILCRRGTKFKLSASVIFKSDEKDTFAADVYEVNRGWGKRRVAFSLRPNIDIKIAVARREMTDLGYYLYPLGGTFSTQPLTDNYDLIVNLEIDELDEPVGLKDPKIEQYIIEGNPSEG